MRVALVTCRQLPEPDPDAPLLAGALEARGATVDLVAWDGEGYDWGAADVAVLRSTWNYYEDRPAFLAWAAQAAAATRLYNPLPVVRWNTHKGYLSELSAQGVPTVPTAMVKRGAATCLAALVAERGWSDVVIKPAVSARSFLTRRFGPGEAAAAGRYFSALVEERDVLVQPYLEAVEDHGERSLVWIDGRLTHSIRKEPRFAEGDERVSDRAVPPPPGAEPLVAAALDLVASPLLYARVDVVPDAKGNLLVMELELVEPSLFLAQSDAALDRFAAAILSR